MQQLIIMQGVPGSGKSDIAWDLWRKIPRSVVCSIGSFYESENDHSIWEREYYRAWCKWETQYWLELGRTVILNNCNLRQKDIQSYIVMAKTLGVGIIIWRLPIPKIIKHPIIPKHRIKRMIHKMETLHV